MNNINTMTMKPPPTTFSHGEVMKWTNECLNTRISNQYIPITIDQALYTIFGSSLKLVTRGIKYDPNATFRECRRATMSLVSQHYKSYKEFGGIVFSMSPSLMIHDTDDWSLAEDENMIRWALRGITLLEYGTDYTF